MQIQQLKSNLSVVMVDYRRVLFFVTVQLVVWPITCVDTPQVDLFVICRLYSIWEVGNILSHQKVFRGIRYPSNVIPTHTFSPHRCKLWWNTRNTKWRQHGDVSKHGRRQERSEHVAMLTKMLIYDWLEMTAVGGVARG